MLIVLGGTTYLPLTVYTHSSLQYMYFALSLMCSFIELVHLFSLASCRSINRLAATDWRGELLVGVEFDQPVLLQQLLLIVA